MQEDWDSDFIPNFIEGTQMYHYAKNEVDYKKKILEDIVFLKTNFNLNSRSIYLINLFLQWFRIPSQPGVTIKVLQNQLKSVLDSYKSIGTFESFVSLFRIFLGVEIEIHVESQSGKITIQMLGYPIYQQYEDLLSSDGKTGFLVETSIDEFKILSGGTSGGGFIDNFYLFVKSLTLVGTELEIKAPIESKAQGE